MFNWFKKSSQPAQHNIPTKHNLAVELMHKLFYEIIEQEELSVVRMHTVAGIFGNSVSGLDDKNCLIIELRLAVDGSIFRSTWSRIYPDEDK